jgi:hypothetical protein
MREGVNADDAVIDPGRRPIGVRFCAGFDDAPERRVERDAERILTDPALQAFGNVKTP